MRLVALTLALALAACTQATGGAGPSTPSSPTPTLDPGAEAALLESLAAKLAQPDSRTPFLELDDGAGGHAYAAFGANHNLAFSASGVTLSYTRESAPTDPRAELDSHVLAERIQVSFPGARVDAPGQGLLPVKSLTSVMRGAAFQADVPTFQAVKFADAYPAIDLYFFDGGDAFSFVFVVKPGGDPSVIHIATSGGDGSVLDPSGVLVVRKGGGELRISHPYTFQSDAAGETAVTSEFQLSAAGTGLVTTDSFAVALGDYRKDLPLVIDPTIVYATLLGNGTGTQLARDPASGDVYVGGPAASYPADSGVFAFARRDGATGQLLRQTLLFGASSDLLRGLHVAGGKLYAAGDTSSPTLFGSFTSTPPAAQPQLAGATDAFVIAFDRLTLAPTYGTYYGGSARDSAAGVRVDADGNIHLAGHTESSDFPLASGTAAAKKFDAFVVKLKPKTGGRGDVVYAATLGGSGNENLTGVGLDGAGNFYAVGRTVSADLPLVNAMPLAYDPAALGFNPFLVKYGPQGNVLFSSYAHANDIENGVFSLGMDVSADGAAIGFGGMIFDPSFQQVGYLAKIVLDPASQRYRVAYTKKPQGTGTIVYDVAFDAAKNLYGVGETGPGFAVTEQTPGLAGTSAFLYVLSDTGSAPSVLYARLFGGTGTDRATSLVVDPRTNDLLIAGSTTSSPFTGLDGTQTTGGAETGFLLRLSAVVPLPKNQPPTAKLAVSGDLTIRDVVFTLDPQTLNLSSNGNWVTATIANDPAARATVQLSAGGSSDPDHDPLTYEIAVAGGGSTTEVDGQASTSLQLAPGSYTATLTVCDPSKACDTATATFVVTTVDLQALTLADLTLNGLQADRLEMDDGALSMKVSRSAFGATVAVGDAVAAVLDGTLHAVDYIRVIDQGGGQGGGSDGGHGNSGHGSGDDGSGGDHHGNGH